MTVSLHNSNEPASTAVDDGPTRTELEAIESEWPLIAAELALVDVEALAAAHPSELAERAVAIASALVATTRNVLLSIPTVHQPIDPTNQLQEIR